MAIVKNSIPYAKALFDLSNEKSITSKVKEDIQSISGVCDSSAEFSDFISNPTISNEDKVATLDKLFSGKVQKETLDFLHLLVKKGRLGQLSSICEACVSFINESENITQVKLTTASAVSDTEQKQIASKFLGENKYEMKNEVNPDIIGGFILEFDNKILDSSVSNQIQTIKNNITK